MHVLIIPAWYPSDQDDVGGIFFREQAHALVKRGCQVGVISPQFRSLRHWRTLWSGEYGLTEESDAGVVTLRQHGMDLFPKLPAFRARRWQACAESLYRAYVRRHGEPDVIHAHSLLHAGVSAQRLSRVNRIPYVVTEHSTAFGRGLVGGRFRRQAASAARGASRLIAVSREFCGLLGAVLPETTGRWEYLPNLVHERFLSAPLSSRRRQPFTFLHVSSLAPQKAVDGLIAAYAAAFGPDPNVRLLIGGDGPDAAGLERDARRAGVGGHVRMLGALPREAVLRHMSECDAFVLPSRTETFGVVLIEALALGKPVIATQCGGPESIVETGDGVLIPVDDVGRLTAALQEMRATCDRYDPVAIRRSCESRFSERAVTQQLVEMYSQVVAPEWKQPRVHA